MNQTPCVSKNGARARNTNRKERDTHITNLADRNRPFNHLRHRLFSQKSATVTVRGPNTTHTEETKTKKKQERDSIEYMAQKIFWYAKKEKCTDR